MKMVNYSIDHPKRVIYMVVALTLVMLAFIPTIKIDTDPENMLSEDEEVRMTHNAMKERYNIYDMVVLGVVNDKHPEGVFNVASLTRIHELSEFAQSLQEVEEIENENAEEVQIAPYTGVISREVMSPSNVDHIESVSAGTIEFNWLMPEPPSTEAEALEIKDRLMSNEMYKNTIVSEDAEAICLYIPITSKDESYKVYNKLNEKIATFDGDDAYHITGLPVAEDTFGVEMFIQMAISAPAAMAFIFLLMFLFFRKIKLIISPMIVAMVSVILTMGLLIATGNTVHIMSSMIPIFIMPIAVLDSVHILSEFFDRYQETRDRKVTLNKVVQELFKPMLYTSLTTAAGFASLALTPIPPVRVFGIFVALGILFAWLLTMIFIPAYIMLMNEKTLENFGLKAGEEKNSLLMKWLDFLRRFTGNTPRGIIVASLLLVGLSIYGIYKIQINDNPVKWFTKDHPIRVADRELNDHFGGTYMAYLSLTAQEDTSDVKTTASRLGESFNTFFQDNNVPDSITSRITVALNEASNAGSKEDFYTQLAESIWEEADNAENDDEAILWEESAEFVELTALTEEEIFKRPEMLEYVTELETFLKEEGGVGNSSSLAALVKKINQELHEGEESFYRIPDNFASVGQCILSFQNSHIPERIQHYVSTDYKGLNLWLQLKSGDNKDMEKTIAAVEGFFVDNPPPRPVDYDWFGLTYINVIWQQKMVAGMLNAFLGSFLVVFLMMSLMFRSVKWGLLCMLPLSLTILIIYGIIGLIGKDYDMPVAVLSSLALGLAVDFSIHFLVRSRAKLKQEGTWEKASVLMFGEPSRAIMRNVIVIAVGFLPLLFANLIPYKTVGIFLASILLLSGLVTLILLPACVKVFEKSLVGKQRE